MNSRRGLQRNSTSGFKGVNWDAPRERWRARYWIDGKVIHIGYYESAFEAAKEYDAAVTEHYGPDAVTNESLRLYGDHHEAK